MNLRWFLQPKVFIGILLWVLLSLRIYPTDLEKTLWHSGKILIGSGLYGLGITIIFNGLLAKFTKKSLNRDQFLKMALWLAVLTAVGASLEFYFGMGK
ncbi:hypothetical protein F1847_00425 [Thermodesulfobacterium sp. TA1]|uniref:hypothetical protein n=1 Tax=Thermodesulfobacterium sp. TA1 TaxID=2234087 RepID=UPI00123203F0|nr:hypothetical protein [Thermodesulfobacterium sp. TA1]QER41275.1 hypothetical protein F1847_00425 [Thermodesulfobacterium sp. TA1]